MIRAQGSILRNQRGQALIMAMSLALGVAAIVGVLLQFSVTTDKFLKGPRVRSAMMGAQQRLKLLAVTPTSFVCTNSTCAGPSDFVVASFPPEELHQYMPGAQCPTANPCGVEIKNLRLSAMGRLLATIEYTGRDLNMKPTDVDIEVPNEVLQSTQSDCFTIDPSRPVFAGFLPNGRPDCRPLSGDCTGPGQYVASVDPQTLRVTCGIFQTDVGCPASQYMTSLVWTGSRFTATCANRPDPFTKFGFTPDASLGPSAIAAAPGPGTGNTCAPPPPPTPSPTPAGTPPPAGTPMACSHPNGPGVNACSAPANGSAYVNNSCDLSKTGQPCCYAWAPITRFGEGGVFPAGGGHEEIHIKCATSAYCATVPDRCVMR